jgi:DNA-binding transcriptional regulator YdaS (Cro superfamily)
MAFETVTTVSSFTTTTNASATTGHVTTERLGPFATGLTWEVTTQRTCTFGK